MVLQATLHPLNTLQYCLGGRDGDHSGAMESAHSSVRDEPCSKPAPPTITTKGMFEALGGEEDGVLSPNVAVVLVIVLLAGDVESGPSCVICGT